MFDPNFFWQDWEHLRRSQLEQVALLHSLTRAPRQDTGTDLMPISASAAARAEEMLRSNPAAGGGGAASNQSLKGLSGIKLSEEDLNDTSLRRPQKRLSSPERWEAQQLIASGVLKVRTKQTKERQRGRGTEEAMRRQKGVPEHGGVVPRQSC
jgi:hypothetical protein